MSSEQNKTRIQKGAWICLYGGLLAVVLGTVFQRQNLDLGDGFQIGGAIVAATGVLLIWLRSRMK